MSASSPPLLELCDLEVRYAAGRNSTTGLTAVRGVSLDVQAGEIHALVGESGSGKTSLARAVLCLLPVDAGQVRLRGEDLSTLPPRLLRQRRRLMQAVFQDPLAALSPRRSVLQTLIEPLQQYRLGSREEWPDRAAALLEMVGLEPGLGQRYPQELSGGQRQRVCLARALAAGPELIVADEPVSSLDRSSRNRVLDLFTELRDRLGLAFLLVSHDLGDVRRVADRVSVMYGGTLVESAPAARLFDQPFHPYTRSLLATVPLPDPAAPHPQVLGGEPPSALTPPVGCVFHKRCPQRLAECAGVAPPERSLAEGGHVHTVRCHLCRN